MFIPLQFFDLPESEFLNALSWSTMAFWSVDILWPGSESNSLLCIFFSCSAELPSYIISNASGDCEAIVVDRSRSVCLCDTLLRGPCMPSRMSFRTGVYNKGVLVMDAAAVARKYARTWLPVDVMLVSIDWIAACLQIRASELRRAASRTSLTSDKLVLVLGPG